METLLTATPSKYEVQRKIILQAPVPEQTRTYKPVSHGQLMDLTLNSIHQAGFVLDREEYTYSDKGSVATGRYAIKSVQDNEMQLQIGWQNSYDKSLTLKFAIGTHIFICKNGCVSGDHGAFKKKHVGTIQEFAPITIVEYIKRSGDVFSKIQRDREQMKTIEIDRRAQSEILGRMFLAEKIIQSTQLNIISRELDKPTHDYGAPSSMWELYQFTTFAMKELHPRLWLPSHIDVHNFFLAETGIRKSSDKPLQFELPAPNQLGMEFSNQNHLTP